MFHSSGRRPSRLTTCTTRVCSISKTGLHVYGEQEFHSYLGEFCRLSLTEAGACGGA